MTKSTSKPLYLIITLLIFLQGCDGNPKNIEPTKGFESLVLKLEDAINYEIENKELNAISMVLVDDQKIVWSKGLDTRILRKKY